MVTGVSRTESAAPIAEEYKAPVEMELSYQALQDGNLGSFFTNMTVGELKRLYYDLDTRTKQAEYYTPLSTNAEAFFASLQVHEDDMVVDLNPQQRAYVEEAVLLTIGEGASLTGDQDSALTLVLTGQELSKELALKIYSYLIGMREKVIPPEFQPDNVSASVQTIKDKYDGVVDGIPQKSQAWTGGR